MIEALESRIAPASIALGTSTVSQGDVSLTGADTLSATLFDALGSGKLVVTGSVSLGGAALSLDVSAIPADLTSHVLVDNDGIDAITGTFAGLPEGSVFKADGTYFKISYTAGDGNDVGLTALVPKVTFTSKNHVASYVDIDGDLVTVKTTAGSFTNDSFVLVPNGDIDVNGAQLAELKLDAGFKNANITVTAKPASSGNGFANIGYFNATGVNLGTVSIKGDVAHLDVGAAGSTPSVKSITVQSIGQFGDSTLEGPLDPRTWTFAARAGNITTKSDIRTAVLLSENGFGNISVGGSFINSEIVSGADIGAVTIKHDLVGERSEESVISAFGKATAPKTGVDLAIKSVTVGGRVEHGTIKAGFSTSDQPLNADASIGPVKVGGDWIASNLTAGTDAGPDNQVGTSDDIRFDNAGMLPGFRNNPVYSQIASITIGGQVLGTYDATDDTFGFVAEWIKSMSVGGVKLPLSATGHNDFLAVAPTGPGATGLRSDVYLAEVYLLA